MPEYFFPLLFTVHDHFAIGFAAHLDKIANENELRLFIFYLQFMIPQTKP